MFEFIQTNRYRCLDGHTSRKMSNLCFTKLTGHLDTQIAKNTGNVFLFSLVGPADLQKTLPALNTDSCHLLIWIFCLHVVSYVCDPFVV